MNASREELSMMLSDDSGSGLGVLVVVEGQTATLQWRHRRGEKNFATCRILKEPLQSWLHGLQSSPHRKLYRITLCDGKTGTVVCYLGNIHNTTLSMTLRLSNENSTLKMQPEQQQRLATFLAWALPCRPLASAPPPVFGL